MALYDNLFQPIRVGPLTVPNRIVRSAHGTSLGGEALIAYHEARAKGGVGMSTIEATGVHPTSFSRAALWNDDIIGFLEEIGRRVHRHGMKLMQQLYHSGASTPVLGPLQQIWGASAVPNPLYPTVPIAMTRGMIDDVVASFASAARRVRDGGLDGVDIHASSGYLIHEFLSPALNKREDEYGGSFENRLRFLKEIITAIRKEVGNDIAVGVRLPNEDYTPGGLDPRLNARIAQEIDPLVDYISLHMGSYWRFHKLIAPADDPLGAEMPANAVITPRCTKPTIVVGRIMTLDHASALIANGEADMVSMVRALIADPELVNKARRAEEGRIRPCIGTNQGCVGQLLSKGVLGCVVNVAAAREGKVSFEPSDKVRRPRKIMIVGGGPAGLEAARTAALRGHDVVLHEASRRLGGQVLFASAAPHRADIGQITRWLESEIDMLGVDVRLNSYVDAEMVETEAPDAVLIATGASPRFDGFQVMLPATSIPGHDRPHVHNAWQLLGQDKRPDIAGPAVIYDDTGTYEAVSAADILLDAGISVTMVSRFEKLGEMLPFPPVTVLAARERLMDKGMQYLGGRDIRSIADDSVEIGVPFTGRREILPAHTVILVSPPYPNRELVDALTERDIPFEMAGDVLGRADLLSAIHGAAKVARAF